MNKDPTQSSLSEQLEILTDQVGRMTEAITAIGHSVEAMGDRMDRGFEQTQAAIRAMGEETQAAIRAMGDRMDRGFEQTQTMIQQTQTMLQQQSQQQHEATMQLLGILQVVLQKETHTDL